MTMNDTLGRLLVSAKMLYANAEGCAINHYGEDFALHGLPGWLADCRSDISAAEAALAHAREAGGTASNVTLCVFKGLSQHVIASPGWHELRAPDGQARVLLAPGSVLYDVTVSAGGMLTAAHAREAVAQEPVAVPAKKLYPAHPRALRASIAELDMWLDSSDTLDEIKNQQSFGESIWLVVHELKRLQAVLAAAPVSPPPDHSEDTLDMVKAPPAESGEVERLISDAWDRLLNVDDRNSPEEYPEMALIQFDELAGFMREVASASHTPAPPPAGHRRVQDAAPARPELDALIAEAKAQAPQPGGAPGYKIGAANRAAVRALMASHLGISRVEISKRLGLGVMAVTRHVAKIRAEWGGQKLPTRRGRTLPTPPVGEG